MAAYNLGCGSLCYCHAVGIKNLGARQIQNRLQNEIPPEVSNLPKGNFIISRNRNDSNENLISISKERKK